MLTGMVVVVVIVIMETLLRRQLWWRWPPQTLWGSPALVVTGGYSSWSGRGCIPIVEASSIASSANVPSPILHLTSWARRAQEGALGAHIVQWQLTRAAEATRRCR